MQPVINNTFFKNSSTAGGAIYNSSSKAFIGFNNIIYENTASASGSEIYLSTDASAYLYNNLLDTNRITGLGQWEGGQNIYGDPEFEDDSCHLGSSSCCINNGLASLEINGTTYYCPEFDIDGEFRPDHYYYLADIGCDEWPYPEGIKEINEDVCNSIIYPNPVTHSANIQYTLYNVQYTILILYDAYGKIVEILVDEEQQAGEYNVSWNAEGLPSGIYFYRLTAGDKVATGKMIKR